jgi:hypothetical protein
VVAASMLALSDSAIAQPATPAPGVESTTVSESKVLCVHRDAPTGSRIGAKSICHTVAEWRAIHAKSDEDMRYLENSRDQRIQGIANATGQ